MKTTLEAAHGLKSKMCPTESRLSGKNSLLSPTALLTPVLLVERTQILKNIYPGPRSVLGTSQMSHDFIHPTDPWGYHYYFYFINERTKTQTGYITCLIHTDSKW